jgi:hypothetical protein
MRGRGGARFVPRAHMVSSYPTESQFVAEDVNAHVSTYQEDHAAHTHLASMYPEEDFQSNEAYEFQAF